MSAAGPYAGLGPQAMLDALAAAGLPCDGRLLQLNSYENRVVQAHTDDGRAIVAKFYRPGRWSDAQILEEHAFACELAANDIPVAPPLALAVEAGSALEPLGVPPTLAAWRCGAERQRVAAALRCAGRAPELEDAEVLERIGHYLGRLHAVGAQGEFRHRRVLEPAVWADEARRVVLGGGSVPAAQEPGWRAAAQAAVEAIAEALARVGPVARLRLHGDCHAGNVLWRDGPHVVDLDDACSGPAVQDLWMLLPGDDAGAARGRAALLQGYEVFRPFDRREWDLVEPLRTMRMLYHSAWIAQRWDDPAFPAAFPWFGTPAYWAQQTTLLREQVELLAPLN